MRNWRSPCLSPAAFNLLRQLGKPKSVDSLTFVSSTSTRNYGFDKFDDALNKFDEMVHMHPRPSIVEFSKLLGAIVRMKHYETAVSLLRQMELLGIHHDDYSLNILLNCFCRLHRMNFGFSVLGKMLKLGLQPSIITFSTLIITIWPLYWR